MKQGQLDKWRMSMINGSRACRIKFFVLAVFVIMFAIIFFNVLFSDHEELPAKTAGNASVIKNCDDNVAGISGSIRITTDKRKYLAGDKIYLSIENIGDNLIYSDPCRDVGVFEKKRGDQWVLMQYDDVAASYKDGNLEKKEGTTECEIDTPINGAGTYRIVMPIFYNCTKPSYYSCEGSEIFRSGEFELEIVTDLGTDK